MAMARVWPSGGTWGSMRRKRERASWKRPAREKAVSMEFHGRGLGVSRRRVFL